MLAILVSSFGKLLVIPMMIWPYDIQFAYAVHVFVLSSNRLSLQTCEHRSLFGLIRTAAHPGIVALAQSSWTSR